MPTAATDARRRAHRARRHQRWLVVNRPADQLWEPGARLLAGERLPAGHGPAQPGHHGNRLGREPRQDAAGLHPQHAGQAARLGVLHRRARPVPHPPGAHAQRRHRDLRQPPRHDRGLQQHAEGPDGLAAAPDRPRAGSRIPAPPDGQAGRAAGAVAGAVAAAGAGQADLARRHRQQPRRWCRSTKASTAPGAASAWRWTAPASPWKTATAARARTSCATCAPNADKKEPGFFGQAVQLRPSKAEAPLKYRINVKSQGETTTVSVLNASGAPGDVGQRAAHRAGHRRRPEVRTRARRCCASRAWAAAARATPRWSRPAAARSLTHLLVDCGLGHPRAGQAPGAGRHAGRADRRDLHHPRARRPHRLRPPARAARAHPGLDERGHLRGHRRARLRRPAAHRPRRRDHRPRRAAGAALHRAARRARAAAADLHRRRTCAWAC